MDFKQLSFNSFIIYFENKISKEVSQKVINTYEAILSENFDFIVDIIPSYSSIVITYDIFKIDFETLKHKILSLNYEQKNSSKSEIIQVDVYYGFEVALDLQDMAKKLSLSTKEIIKIHSSKVYDIFAIGFLPAFAYMGNVSQSIQMPRLESPRKSVPKGSVGIADTQTAIYPQNSPGGWNIIGRTAFECFDKSLDTLSPFKVGTKVKFNPITKEQFLNQGGQI